MRTMWIPPEYVVKDTVLKYGTPTYLYSADFIEVNYLNLRSKLCKSIDIFYSMKANPNISVVKKLSLLGTGAEVSSLTELKTAIKAGVKPENIIFVGPAKNSSDINECLSHNIHAIVCESIDELCLVNDLAGNQNLKDFPVILRINPNFKSKGAGLSMSGKPRQFGIDEDVLRDSKNTLKELSNISCIGFHVYMGTRYLNHEFIIMNTLNIIKLAEDLALLLEIEIYTLDIGGGLGVTYFENEKDLDLDALSNGINSAILEFKNNNPEARVVMELGRFLVAGCGVLLTQVEYLKNSMGENFAICDGGTNLHMAAVGIGSFVKRNFPMINFSSDSTGMEDYSVTGPLCTPNDTIAKKISLQKVSSGDILGVLMSGAYGPTASPVYFLSHGYPSEVICHGDKLSLTRTRDRYQDMLEKQVCVF